MPKEHRFIFHAKRTAAPRSKKKRELYQLVLADTDIRTALGVADDFLTLLSEWPNPDKPLPYHLTEACMAHIAVSYTRPFTHGKRSSIPSLSPKWEKCLNPAFQETHNLIIGGDAYVASACLHCHVVWRGLFDLDLDNNHRGFLI